jgi:hypothetical protein
MPDLREGVGWVVGSTIAAIGAFASWFYQSGLFGTVVGIMIGAGITYFVQTRTQKRIWKREYSLRAIEQIYSPLYGVIIELIKILEQKDNRNWSFGHWDSVEKDYRYFMVDKKFRAKLDAFSNDMKKRNDAINKLETLLIPQIIKDTARETFPEKPNDSQPLSLDIEMYLKGKQKVSFQPNLIFHLKKHQTLDDIADYATQNLSLKKEEISDVCSKIVFWKEENPLDPYRQNLEKKGDHSQSKFVSINQKYNLDFYAKCLHKTELLQEYQLVIGENDKLLEYAKEIKKELIKRIEEPWNI